MSLGKFLMVAGLLAVIAFVSYPPRQSVREGFSVPRACLFSKNFNSYESSLENTLGAEGLFLPARIDVSRLLLECALSLAVSAIGATMLIPNRRPALPNS